MTKMQFETSLRARLRGIPENEVNRYVEYYMEMINDRIDEGMGEDEAVAAVGHLDDIEARIRSERQQQFVNSAKPEGKKKLSSGAAAAIIIGCILFSPLIIGLLGIAIGLVFGVIGIAIGLFFAAVGIYIGALACVAAGFGIMFISIFSFSAGMPANGLFMLGGGFFLTGISILIVIALNRLAALIIRSIGRLFMRIDRRFARGGMV